MDLNVKTSDGKKYTIPIEDQHEMLVRKTIHRHDNPNPMLFVSIILLIIMLIYYIYIYGIKNNITGFWYDGNAVIYLNQCIWSDVIYIKGYACGHVRGNAVFIINATNGKLPFMGTFFNKKIYWVNGMVWDLIQYA